TLYKLNPESIVAAAHSDRPEPEPEIAYDGTNTAVALAAMKLGHDEEFDRVEESLRRIIPNVERVRIRQAVVQRQNPAKRRVLGNVVGSAHHEARVLRALAVARPPCQGIACRDKL